MDIKYPRAKPYFSVQDRVDIINKIEVDLKGKIDLFSSIELVKNK